MLLRGAKVSGGKPFCRSTTNLIIDESRSSKNNQSSQTSDVNKNIRSQVERSVKESD